MCALVLSAVSVASAQTGYTVGLADGDGRMGQWDVPVDISIVNEDTVIAGMMRFEYDSTKLTPVTDPVLGSPFVSFDLGARASDYETDGIVSVVCSTPGELKISFMPSFGGNAEIAAGSGVVFSPLFDVATDAAVGETSFDAVDSASWINSLHDPSWGTIYPTLGAGSVLIRYYRPGDVNNDGVIDEDDVDYLVAYIFQSGPAPRPLNSADVDHSCQIDVADLVKLVGRVYHNDPSPLWPGCVE